MKKIGKVEQQLLRKILNKCCCCMVNCKCFSASNTSDYYNIISKCKWLSFWFFPGLTSMRLHLLPHSKIMTALEVSFLLSVVHLMKMILPPKLLGHQCPLLALKPAPWKILSTMSLAQCSLPKTTVWVNQSLLKIQMLVQQSLVLTLGILVTSYRKLFDGLLRRRSV